MAARKTLISSQTDNVAEETRCDCWFPKRYFLVFMQFMGTFCLFALRTNISIAIIEMTKNRTTTIDNHTIQYEPEFQWNSKDNGLVLSMYGYGALFSLIGGILIKKLGGLTVFNYSLLVSGCVTLLNPLIVRIDFNLFLLARLVEGICDNFCYVSTPEIWSRWSSKKERSRLISFVFTGAYVGSAVNFPLCGFLSRFYGWPSAFHFTGGMAIVISIITILSFSDDPADDKCVSNKELKHLTQDLERSSKERITYPLREFITMKALWALLVAKIAYSSNYSFIAAYLPSYVKDMTGMEIDRVGVLSGIPNIASIFTVPLAGYMVDYFQNAKILNNTQVHKLYMTVGFFIGATCLFAVSSISNFTINMVLLVIFKILISLIYLVTKTIPIYMAPRHSSSIAAVTSYGFSFGSFITPTMIGYVVTSHEHYQWSICLSSIGAIMLIAGVIFILFGSSEVQEGFREKPRGEYEENNEIPTVFVQIK